MQFVFFDIDEEDSIMFDKRYCDIKDDMIRQFATQLFYANYDFDTYITVLRYWYINKLDLFYSLK